MSENELSNNIPELKKLIIDQHNQISEKDKLIQDLKDKINLLQKKQFAPKSEVVTSEALGLFNEAEELDKNNHNSLEEESESEEETKESKKKKKKKRARLPAHLPREEFIIDLEEKDKVCVHDGATLVKIGEEISEKLNIIPAKAIVKKTIRIKYGCPCCDESIKTPPPPVTILPKSMASASLIAYIVIAKYMDGLPLYRQEAIFNRIGVELTRQSMARWIIQVSFKLMPLYNLLQDLLLEKNYLQMDESHVQVLKEDGKKATSKSYMWVRHAPGINPIVLFNYSPTRSGEVPIELLSGFKGHLQVDGYDGYARVCEENKLIRLGCNDHGRRKFDEAFKTSGGKAIGKKGLIFYKALYKIEERIEKFSSEEKLKVRQVESKAIFTEMKEWVDDKRKTITPKSVGGKAINYFHNEYKYLIGFLEDGKLNISNCGVENKIRPFAVGRKNWLFSASVEGADASAMFYSLIETAKANDLEPFDWLTKVLEKLPHANTVEDYEDLLPFQKK
jgi:transposase